MGYHEVMQVCLKGHQITDHYNEYQQRRQDFCSKCGAKTIYQCPKCNTPIRGDYIVEGVLDMAITPIPYNCHQCGARYPWANRLRRICFLKSLAYPVKLLFEILSKIFRK